MTNTVLRCMIVLSLLAMSSQAARAVDTEDDTPPTPTETTTECEDGQIWDPKTQSCLASDASVFTDEDRYKAVRELAYAGRIQDAISVLESAESPQDPRFLNYHGFTQRKLGNMDAAMAYYRKALEIDPDYVLARAYMGQGLVAIGNVAEAKHQLAEIRKRTGAGSWPYIALKRTLANQPSTY